MKFEVCAIRVEEIDALMVQRDTFGSVHTIKMASGILTIALPVSPNEHCARSSLTNDPDNIDHTWFGVGSVTLSASVLKPINFRGDESQFNSITVHQCSSSEIAMKSVQEILDDGFDLWKRTLRWTGFAANIGIGEVETNFSATRGRGYKMYKKDDVALFRNYGGATSSHGQGEISREAWQSAGDALSNDEIPPVWFDYLHESTRMAVVGNFRAAVIYSAIAAETVLRAAFAATLPTISSKTANRILERASIQSLLSRVHEILNVPESEAEKFGKIAVQKLFRMRNNVMHQGLRENGSLSDVKALQPKIAMFVLKTDEFINKLLNNPNRIFRKPNLLD